MTWEKKEMVARCRRGIKEDSLAAVEDQELSEEPWLNQMPRALSVCEPEGGQGLGLAWGKLFEEG